jgi:thiosulfate dehydrogenase [quinone] large subunit
LPFSRGLLRREQQLLHSIATNRRSTRALSALIGFIVLFAAINAGYLFVDAAWAKWNDPTWTGHRAGTAISGFLTGADQKATPTAKNPHPDVLPKTRDLNNAVVKAHPRLFAWMVALGELCVPVAALILLCVRFRGSRGLALLCAGIAALMNLIYMLEGSSGLNPLILVMWMTVLWLVATLPVAALFYAIDLRRVAGDAASDHPRIPDCGGGLWVFYGFMFLLLGCASWLLQPDRVFLVLALTAILVAVALYAINQQIARYAVASRTLVARRGRGPAPVQGL